MSALFVTLMYLVTLLIALPFKRSDINWLATVGTQFMLFVVFFGALLLKSWSFLETVGGEELAAEDGVPKVTKMRYPTDAMLKAGGEGAKDTLEKWYDACAEWRKVNEKDGDIDNWDDLDKDVRIVVARPFIEHLMHNVIMTVSGRDTGPVGRSNSDAAHEPCPDRPPSNHRRRHALRPGGHATFGQVRISASTLSLPLPW